MVCKQQGQIKFLSSFMALQFSSVKSNVNTPFTDLFFSHSRHTATTVFFNLSGRCFSTCLLKGMWACKDFYVSNMLVTHLFMDIYNGISNADSFLELEIGITIILLKNCFTEFYEGYLHEISITFECHFWLAVCDALLCCIEDALWYEFQI